MQRNRDVGSTVTNGPKIKSDKNKKLLIRILYILLFDTFIQNQRFLRLISKVSHYWCYWAQEHIFMRHILAVRRVLGLFSVRWNGSVSLCLYCPEQADGRIDSWSLTKCTAIDINDKKIKCTITVVWKSLTR